MKNKKYWLLTSLVTLLPIAIGLLLWDRLPDKLPTHFNASGVADGWGSKGFAVFGVPLMWLIFHILTLAAMRLDKQNHGHNEKVLKLVGLVFPALSILFSVLMFSHGLGIELDLTRILLTLLGLFFIAVGNWLPKIKQNATLGIKIKWTLYNEENWNRTHRFGGWCWVIGGLGLTVLGLLTGAALLPALFGTLALMVLLPTVYSWRLSKRQQRDGTWTESQVSRELKQHPAIKIVSLVLVTLILAATGFVMFSGEIVYTCTEDELVIDADYWTDSAVPYSAIRHMELRDTAPEGVREFGWGSAKLVLGACSNEEFGSHLRYSYTGVDAYIVLETEGQTILLTAENEEATRALYETLLGHVG